MKRATPKMALTMLMAAVLAGCGGGGGDDAAGDGGSTSPGAPANPPGGTAPPASPTYSQRVSRGFFDYDNNGVADATEVFTYDAQGRMTRRVYTYVDDGTRDLATPYSTMNEVQDNTYDAQGRLLSNTATLANGNSTLTTLQYGSDGLLARTDVVSSVGSAVVSSGYFTYTYAAGKPSEMVFHDVSGVALMRQTITHGADGFPRWVDMANLVNLAVPNPRTELAWNADGTIRTRLYDLNRDSVVEEAVDYLYSGGRLVSSVKGLAGMYAGRPGAVKYTFTYDTQGRLSGVDGDLANDGSIDTRHQIEYEAGICRTTVVPLLLPLITSTGYGSSTTGVYNPCAS